MINGRLFFGLMLILIFSCNTISKKEEKAELELEREEYKVIGNVLDYMFHKDSIYRKENVNAFDQEVPFGYEKTHPALYHKKIDSIKAVMDTAKLYITLRDSLIRFQI